MVVADNPDPRLALALKLLRSILEGADEEHDGPEINPAHFSFIPPPPVPSEKRSATDLLNWWFRPTSSATDPWDEYFNQSPRWSSIPVQPEARPRTDPPVFRKRADDVEDSSTELWHYPWLNLKDLITEPEEELAYENAEAAVGCLYDFIHAISSREIDAAMSLVAEDYHVLHEDREIDKQGLQRQLEVLVDSLRGWELESSLAEVPVPVFHPHGILIYAEIQIEAVQPRNNLRRSIVERRVAVFRQQYSGEWMISAFSPI
jgi:ketosteroid isomerase-like protein